MVETAEGTVVTVTAPHEVVLELAVEDVASVTTLELVIEARVKTTDIAHVSLGQQALVRLPALNQRITPTIMASVAYVSADALPEQKPSASGGQSVRSDYYIARVRLDEEDVRKHLAGFRPTPGMPADVYLQTGERTFFEYIMRPVFDSFSRAFRET